MRLVKRGVFLVFVLLLINSVYAASFVESNLTRTEFGKEVPFQGYLKINFTEPQEVSKLITFNSGSRKFDLSLGKIINLTNFPVTYIDPSYKEKPNGREGELTLTFASAGTKREIGVDLRGGSSNNPIVSSIVDVRNFSFDLEALTTVEKPSIFIGDTKVYSYRANELNFEALNKSYLGNNNADGSQGITQGNIYCQIVNVTASGKYNVKALVSRTATSNAKLNATMITNDGTIPSGLPQCTKENPCCELNGIQNSFSEASCLLEKNIPEDRQEYLCVYATGTADPNVNYFSIRTKNSETITGYVNGVESFSGNFFIFGDYMKYQERFNPGTVKVTVPASEINSYIQGETGCRSELGTECLLIPLRVDAKSSGSLKFKNLDVKYLASSQSLQKTSFKEIVYLDNAIKYDGDIRVDLERLFEVLTPNSLGNYTYFVQFDGKSSSQVKFRVVNGPEAYMTVSNLNPALNEVVNFDASRSKAPSGKNITEYLWNFGDGTNGTGKTITHSYALRNNYDVKLTVKDNSGVYGVDILTLVVNNGSVNGSGSLIEQSLKSINDFNSYLSSSPENVKTAVELLGLNSQLQSYQANLTRINGEYQTILNNGNLSESERANLINPLLLQVSTISKQIPISIRVDMTSFNGEVSSIGQIRSCCEFTTETQKSKLLNAQRNVTVNAEARAITLILTDGTERRFTLIRKIITGSGAKIYEFLPVGFTLTQENIVKGGNMSNAGIGIHGFSFTNEIVYVLETTDLSKALQSKTAVLPFDLENIEEVTTEEVKVSILSECGNNICEDDEDINSCSADCSEQSNSLVWIIGIIVILLIGAIIYFGLFFKGGYLNKKFGSSRNVNHGTAKGLFKTESGYFAVKNYVQSALSKGLREDQIVRALEVKGWKHNQIEEVLREVKFKKGPEFKPAYKH